MATILIVDDHPSNRDLLVTLLGYRKHVLLQAGDGAEALQITRAEKPDLIISDILMPTMDGFEFVRQLRADPRISKTKVIFFTAAYLKREAQGLALSCGVTQVITKPAEPEAIYEAVDTALGIVSHPMEMAIVPQEFNREHLSIVTNKLATQADELRSTNERLTALIELSQELGQEKDISRLVENFCTGARKIMGAKYAAIGTVDSAGRLKRFTTSGLDADTVSKLGAPNPKAALTSVLLSSRTTRNVTAIEELKLTGLPLNFPPFHAFLGATISSTTNIYGWVCFLDKIGVGQFTLEDEKLASILSSQLGRIYEFVERNVAELSASEARKTAMLDASFDGIITLDAQGKVLEFNAAAVRTFGYSQAAVIGKDLSVLIIPPGSTAAQGLDHYLNLVADPVLNKRVELTAMRADSTCFPVELGLTRIKQDGPAIFIGFVRNITERKQAEESVSASEIRYRRLFESAKDGILILDAPTARITDVNPYMTELLGYSHTELIGKELWELGLFKNVEASQTAMRELLEKHYIRYEDLSLKTKTGSRVDVEVVSNVYSEDHHTVIQCNIRDITERRRAAEHKALEDRRKDEFMAMLAHELRNPLTPIKAAAQILLMSGSENPVVIRTQEIIERQANHMIRLVDDLLDISRLQSGKVRLKKETLNFAKVVAEGTDYSNHLIKSHGHKLILNLQVEPPLSINADSGRIVQIVSNIVCNAAKYTPNNGVLQVTTCAENGMAVVRVRDNGAGIDPDMLLRIFDVYTQVEQSLDRSQGGLGLGLKLVKELVQLHEGTVEAFSEGLGKGTEFVVKIPLAQAQAQVITPEVPVHPTFSGIIGRRVLLVEDSADTRELMEVLLMMNGHKIETAEDGFQGVTKALTMLPDVALIDIGLPVLNGYEVAKAIRAGPGGDKIVLIALTGYGQSEDKQRAYLAGFDDHLTKRADWVDLFAILNNLEKYNRVGYAAVV